MTTSVRMHATPWMRGWYRPHARVCLQQYRRCSHTDTHTRAGGGQAALTGYYRTHPDRCYLDDLWRPGMARRAKMAAAAHAHVPAAAADVAGPLIDAWLARLL
jgi:hypothetical protein